jgi:hypothetical protein
LVATADGVKDVLDLFASSGFCKGYRLGEQQQQREEEGVPLFDELDDDAARVVGTSVDCLIGVLEPATLGASLQITGEQSSFAPDVTGPTLAAAWERAGFSVTWESFFVDPTYRPNPKGKRVVDS